jgi:hypothetical protein
VLSSPQQQRKEKKAEKLLPRINQEYSTEQKPPTIYPNPSFYDMDPLSCYPTMMTTIATSKRNCRALSLSERSSSSSSVRRPTKVRFDSITIVEFPIVLGVEVIPSTGGAPLALGSKPSREVRLGLDHFECIRPPRRSKRNLILDPETRTAMLLKSGYSFEAVATAALSCYRIQESRGESVREDLVKRKQLLNKMVDSTRRAIKSVVRPIQRSEVALTA